MLQAQAAWREELEARPVQFLARDLEGRLDDVREQLAELLDAEAQDLVFVRNATYGVNSVLRSFPLEPGDELLVTDQEYNACRNVLDFVAQRAGAVVRVAVMPWPVSDPQVIVESITRELTPRTRLLLVDHITSPTATVLPMQQIVEQARQNGTQVLVDGAHAPGHLPLSLRSLGADYYTGNCHKWINAPKGAALLWVRRDRQEGVRPACISHGANSPREDRSRFLVEFDWTGTDDPTAVLSIPAALHFIEQRSGSWAGVQQHNRELVRAGRDRVLDALGVEAPVADELLGAMATIPLPLLKSTPPDNWDPLQTALREQYRIEVPVFTWGGRDGQPARRGLRISAQLYNEPSDYQRLADALYSLGASSAPV